MFKLLSNKTYINKKKNLFLILLVLAISAIPRFWKLDISPPVVVDEPANIRDINLILKNGLSLTTFHWDYSKSQIVHLPGVLLIKLGVSNKLIALRYASVIISLASLIPFFMIAKYYSTMVVAFSTTLLFSFSYYFLQFSRVGWTDVTSGIFLGLTLFWIIIKIKDTKKQNLKLIALGGVIAGFIFYGYRSGIITILTAMFTLIPKRIGFFKNSRFSLGHFLLFLLFFILTSFPWIKATYQNREKYNLRLRVVSVKNVDLPYHDQYAKKNILKYQIKQTLNSWIFLKPVNLSGTESPRYLPQGVQIVDWFVKIGFWIGIILGLSKVKNTYPLFMIILMGLYGQIITIDPPNGARGLIMLPCIYLFFAIFLNKILSLYKTNKYVPVIIIFLSIIYSISDFLFYQYWMSWIKV